jgi:hypothetical protein
MDPAPDPDPTLDPAPVFGDFKEAKKKFSRTFVCKSDQIKCRYKIKETKQKRAW